MNKALMIVTIVANLALLAPASARIGETSNEIQQRYGKPTKDLGQEADNIHRFLFEKGNISIRVTYQGTESVEEVFRTTDDSELSDAAVDELLKANVGKSTWKQSGFTDAELDWERADEQVIAKKTKPSNVLTIINKKYAETLAKKGEKPADSGVVNGL